MKKIASLLLNLLLGITISFGQNDCIQNDGSYRYQAKLYIENVPNDFDKDDFINYIIGLDNISNDDLATLNTNLTEVYKTFPSQDPHDMVTVGASIEIYSILEDLNNSIELHYCVLEDCSKMDGTYSYLTLLTNGGIQNDFNKEDFINYILVFDDISNDDLSILNTHITSVAKGFPTAVSEFLQRVVVIDATTEIYSILASLTNAIEFHQCSDGEGTILSGTDDISKRTQSIVYPNPITEDSVIKLTMNSTAITLELINISGQIIYSERISDRKIIELKNLAIDNGISFLTIYDETNGTKEILKIVKEK